MKKAAFYVNQRIEPFLNGLLLGRRQVDEGQTLGPFCGHERVERDKGTHVCRLDERGDAFFL